MRRIAAELAIKAGSAADVIIVGDGRGVLRCRWLWFVQL
jgi:hypothetical protein